MAFGFPAYHEEEASFPIPVTHEWIAYACRENGCAAPFYTTLAGGAVGWTSSKSVSMWSWGESLRITLLGPSTLRIRSECAMPTQCFDWGRNAKNVHAFVSTLLAAMAAQAAR